MNASEKEAQVQKFWANVWVVLTDNTDLKLKEVYEQPKPGSPLTRVEKIKHALEAWGDARVDATTERIKERLFGGGHDR